MDPETPDRFFPPFSEGFGRGDRDTSKVKHDDAVPSEHRYFAIIIEDLQGGCSNSKKLDCIALNTHIRKSLGGIFFHVNNS